MHPFSTERITCHGLNEFSQVGRPHRDLDRNDWTGMVLYDRTVSVSFNKVFKQSESPAR